MNPTKSCIFFLIDGARPDVFEDKLKRGVLPNIAKYIVEPGTYQRGTTVFPSTTGPAYLPFITGCFPGPCNVSGIRWFDRKEFGRTAFSLKRFRSYVGPGSLMMNFDWRPEIPSLFEMAERPVNIFSMVNRGSGLTGNRTRYLRMLYMYYAHLTDHWGFVDEQAIRKMRRSWKKNPDFSFVVLPAVDEYAHLTGPFSAETKQAYVEADRLIGLVIEDLKKLGRLDDTMLMISSDHGLSSTSAHFGLDQFIEEKGYRNLYYPLIFKQNITAASMVSGNGMAHVYLRGKSWNEPIYAEEIESQHTSLAHGLLEQEEVDFIAMKMESGSILFTSQKGRAEIISKEGGYTYRPIEGDPMGLSGVAKKPLGLEEALGAGFDSDYPDGMVQLAQLFESPRTGDIIVSATPGFDLRAKYESPEHHASHGSMHREHMHVPIACNRPLTEGPMRTVDCFSTMAHYLSLPTKTPIQGTNRLIA